jgi:hypothetical protein
MYGLPQAGILAQQLLEARLNAHGYRQSTITPGLWRHDFRPISFTLCVDDFGIKYVGKEHVDHLSGILGNHYKCSHDWTGTRYLGMDIDWDYTSKKSPSLNAWVCPRSANPFPASSTQETATSTIPAREANLRRNKTIHS